MLRFLMALMLMFFMGCQSAPVPVSGQSSLVQLIKLRPDVLKIHHESYDHYMLEGPLTPIKATALVAAIDHSEGKNHEVFLEINSPGGSVQAALFLTKKIERSQVKVTCVVDGHAISAALMVYMSCHERQATVRSRLMFHQPSVSGEIDDAQPKDLMNMGLALMALWETMCQDMEAKTGIPAEDWAKNSAGGKEFWMSATEAKILGVVQELVGPLKYLPTKPIK